jgi:toxin ParE1/3/4
MGEVFFAAAAEDDMFELYRYIYSHDSPGHADTVYQRIKETCNSLTCTSLRGHLPAELERISIREYREIHFKPYRIIYQVMGADVIIHAVLDGRRSLQEVLERRLLR